MFSRIFPRHKALSDQAGFVRRGLALTTDTIIIGFLSLLIYGIFSELKSMSSEESGLISQLCQALKEGSGFSIKLREDKKSEKLQKDTFLEILKARISENEYRLAEKLSAEEIYRAYEKEFIAAGHKLRFVYLDESYNLIKEYLISLLYFVFFFRTSGRTPGKRVFRLKVVDLKGNSRLGWYQCFERAHGYVCSGLFGSLGFWQVLWNKQGLAMHDKIAGTTVIKLPKKKKTKKARKKTTAKNSQIATGHELS